MNTRAFGMPGPFEMLIIGAIGLLIFGKRLPEVGRSIGKTIVEFKRGMKEVEQEIHQVDSAPDVPATTRPPQTAGYKFDPYTGKPIDESSQPRA